MFNKLIIQNFQSHENSELEFSPGVNAIIGSSDSGKSAIKRAICAITDNKFNIDFIRKNEKQSSIQLIIDENIITRSRSRTTDNIYKLNEDLFEGFGTALPENISKIINFNELNVQHQADSHFLLSETAGEVSRFLNKTVDLEDMDITLKNLNSKKKKTSSELSYTESEKEELKKSLSEFDNLEEIEKIIVFGEQIENEILVIQEAKENLLKIIHDVKYLDEKLANLDGSEEEFSLVQEALKINNELNESKKTSYKLKNLLDSIYKIENKIEEHEEQIKSFDIVNECLLLYSNYKKEQTNISKLQNLINKLDITNNKIIEKEKNIIELQKEWKEKMPETCPLCGNKINHK